jgi:hypothetical protein
MPHDGESNLFAQVSVETDSGNNKISRNANPNTAWWLHETIPISLPVRRQATPRLKQNLRQSAS